jgi:hypothetical protein
VSVRTRLSLVLPDASGLRGAPERSTLALLDIALAVAEHTLHAEHPTLDELFDDPTPALTPTLLAASLLTQRCRELRRLLVVYDAALRDALGERDCHVWDHDIPF